jgi:hypothetical protein
MHPLGLFIALRDRLSPASAAPAAAGEAPIPLDDATFQAWGAWAARERATVRARRVRTSPASGVSVGRPHAAERTTAPS